MTRRDVAPAGMLRGMCQDSCQWVQVGTFQRVLQGMYRGLAFSQTPARKAGTGTPERDDVAAVAVLRGDLQWQMERKCVRRRERS